MKKLFVLFVSGLLSLTATAQQSDLVGSWQLLDANGNPRTYVKVFMPDGKLLGQSFNDDFTVSSVWFMSNYKVLNDSSYADHAFYHSNILYERDYYVTFHKESDSLLVSTYIDYRMNNLGAIMTERWKKMNRELPVYTDAEWKALQQKSMAEFDRLPQEGQTVEQYAQKLYDKAQDYQKSNKLDRACEALLMRAELDTTNLAWQKDAAQFFLYRHMAPAAAEKIVNRIIRLAEAQAPTPTDTSVVRAYRNLAYMYSYRGNNALPQVRSTINKVIDMETKAGHQPSEGYGLDYYVLAETYLPEGNFKVMGDCIEKCINILEKVPNVFKAQMGEAYMLKGISLIRTDRIHEGIEVLLNQAVPNFLAEDSPVKEKVPLMVYPLVFNAYGDLIEKNPKDKNLLKEYQQFMADKLLVAVFNSTDKKRNLFGEYYVVENGSWNVENPVPSFDNLRFVLQKGDEHMEVVKDSEDEQVGIMRIDIVDAAKKQEVINKWKAYKKDKKVKK